MVEKPESQYQKCITDAIDKISSAGKVDLVVGIPLLSAWEDAHKMISILSTGMGTFYPGLKYLFVTLSCPHQSAPGAMEVYEPGNQKPIVTSQMEGTLHGRGWAVRGLVDIGHRLSADLMIVEPNLLPKDGEEMPAGFAPEWVKLMYQPVRDNVAEFVLPRFKMSHLANPVGSHFIYPLLATLFNLELKGGLDAGMVISRQLLSKLTDDLTHNSGDIYEYGVNYWIVARVAEMGVKTAEVFLGAKPKASLPVSLNYLFSQAAHVMFQFIGESQKVWMNSPQAVRSALAVGRRENPFLEETMLDVRPRIEQFRRGYNRYYEAVWSRIYSEDINSQLVRIIKDAEVGREQFTFPDMLWAQIVYETLIAYQFIPAVDREDLVNGLAALFEGRLAGYFLEIEEASDVNEATHEPTGFKANPLKAQEILTVQTDRFISRKTALQEKWLHHREELRPFLPEISYWEYIPGVPILLPHVAKAPSGESAHVYPFYEKLLKEYSDEFTAFAGEHLGLKPEDGHEKISRGLRELVNQLEEDLDEILLPGNLHNLRGAKRITEKIFRLYPSPQSMSLKESTAKRLLRANQPRNLITRWGFRNIEELLRSHNALDVLALAPWSEIDKYNVWNTEWFRENLTPDDFEMSPVQPLVVDYTEFPALTSMAEASSLYHLTSRVVISNLRAGSGGEFPKIRFLTTTLKRITEAEMYSKAWESFRRNCPVDEFADCVINSIGGHWGMGMFSAHSIFENTQQMILRDKLLQIAEQDWELSGAAVEKAQKHLARMANAYHLGLTLPDGVFVTSCIWSWASYSSKGGKGIPTPLSLMVERRWFSSELFSRLFEQVMGSRDDILPIIIDLMGQNREKEDMAVRYLGAVPVESELIIDHQHDLESPPAGKMVRSIYNPILAPKPEHDWENKYVLNCGAIRLDGSVYIFYRAVGDDGISRIGLAISKNGLQVDERVPEPVFVPDNDSEKMGVEDPRLVSIDGRIYMLYTAYDGIVPQIAMASISEEDAIAGNWDAWYRDGLLFPGFHNKDAILFPERFKDRLVLYHRIAPSMWITYSDTFTTPWPREGHQIVMGTRSGMTWDAVKIGAGAQPIKTKFGWLLIYHGVDYVFCYRLGVIVTALDDPSKLLYRSPNPVLEPEASYEIGISGKSWVPNVVFTCGAVSTEDKEILDEEDEILVYYGGADTVIGVATAKVKDLIPEKHRIL